MVIKRPLGNMSLHSLLNTGAKIRINLETNKKKKENLQDSDFLSIFAIENSIVELKLNYNEKEKTFKCKVDISRKYL